MIAFAPCLCYTEYRTYGKFIISVRWQYGKTRFLSQQTHPKYVERRNQSHHRHPTLRQICFAFWAVPFLFAWAGYRRRTYHLPRTRSTTILSIPQPYPFVRIRRTHPFRKARWKILPFYRRSTICTKGRRQGERKHRNRHIRYAQRIENVQKPRCLCNGQQFQDAVRRYCHRISGTSDADSCLSVELRGILRLYGRRRTKGARRIHAVRRHATTSHNCRRNGQKELSYFSVSRTVR